MHIFRKYFILTILVIVGLCSGGSLLDAAKTDAVVSSDILLIDLQGTPVNFSNFINKPTILFFWTTWCPYCRKELKLLNQQASVMTKEGILVIGVNLSESQNKVQRFFKGYSLNFKMLLDRDGLLADKYDLMGVPTYVFLDKNGKEISQAHSFPDNYRDLLFK